MKITGDITILLPFTIDYCAKGPEVPPMPLSLNGKEMSIFFPPSMSEGTDGKSFFETGWAWWTGTSLRVVATEELMTGLLNPDLIRADFVSAINEALRRFLNACRLLFQRPDIFPVLIDVKDLHLIAQDVTGNTETFPESSNSFFFHHIPSAAPLETSINEGIMSKIEDEINRNQNETISKHLQLDADWLDSLGESRRAIVIRDLASKISKEN